MHDRVYTITVFHIMITDLNDFSNEEKNLLFFPHHLFSCNSQYIDIKNDSVNEATEQLFAIQLSLVSGQNPSLIVLSRNVSIGIIIDDDRKLSIMT